MNHPASLDLKSLPLQQRNKAVDLVKRSNAYYNLINQVLSTDIKTLSYILNNI